MEQMCNNSEIPTTKTIMPIEVLQAISEFSGSTVRDIEMLDRTIELHWDSVRGALQDKFVHIRDNAYSGNEEEIQRWTMFQRIVLPLRLELARIQCLLDEFSVTEYDILDQVVSEEKRLERNRKVARTRLQYSVTRLKCVYLWLTSDARDIGEKIRAIILLILKLASEI